MAPGLARANGKDNKFLISHNKSQDKNSVDNIIANRNFTNCYNIKMLNRLWKKCMLFSWNFA
jgi:hypothetical protein